MRVEKKDKTPTTDRISPAALRALRLFRDRNGDRWQSALGIGFLRGGHPSMTGDEWAPIQAMRNSVPTSVVVDVLDCLSVERI